MTYCVYTCKMVCYGCHGLFPLLSQLILVVPLYPVSSLGGNTNETEINIGMNRNQRYSEIVHNLADTCRRRLTNSVGDVECYADIIVS